MSIISEVRKAVEDSPKAVCAREIGKVTGLRVAQIQPALYMLEAQNMVKVVRIGEYQGNTQVDTKFYRPYQYQFKNKWLEGWCGAPELGLTQWMRDKVRVFQMRCQEDFGFLPANTPDYISRSSWAYDGEYHKPNAAYLF